MGGPHAAAIMARGGVWPGLGAMHEEGFLTHRPSQNMGLASPGLRRDLKKLGLTRPAEQWAALSPSLTWPRKCGREGGPPDQSYTRSPRVRWPGKPKNTRNANPLVRSREGLHWGPLRSAGALAFATRMSFATSPEYLLLPSLSQATPSKPTPWARQRRQGHKAFQLGHPMVTR